MWKDTVSLGGLGHRDDASRIWHRKEVTRKAISALMSDGRNGEAVPKDELSVMEAVVEGLVEGVLKTRPYGGRDLAEVTAAALTRNLVAVQPVGAVLGAMDAASVSPIMEVEKSAMKVVQAARKRVHDELKAEEARHALIREARGERVWAAMNARGRVPVVEDIRRKAATKADRVELAAADVDAPEVVVVADDDIVDLTARWPSGGIVPTSSYRRHLYK